MAPAPWPEINSVLDDEPEASLPLRTPAAPLPAAPSVAPARRAFGDIPAIRQRIYDRVLQAAQQVAPVTNQRYTLSLGDVTWRGPERYSLAEQKRAILHNASLGRELRGTWTLTDNATGRPVGTRAGKLGVVPFMTERGTFINNGVEYTMSHQMRLRGGAYTRVKENGELETHVNVLPGKGRAHRIFLDPETGVFRVQLGQARIPLLPVLRAMGVSDSTLREQWGNGLAAANMAHSDPKALAKLYERLARRAEPGADDAAKRQTIADAFRSMELDDEITKRTLGAPYRNVDENALLAITKKLLAVSRGEQAADDRDELAYQTIVGPEDVFAERLQKSGNELRRALWKATAAGNLDKFPSGVFQKTISHALLGSGLAAPIEEVNPAEIYDQQARVTRMGEGGIPSTDSVTLDARAVQPSQFGFIDTLRTPESGRVGVDLRLARGAQKGDDGRLYTRVIDPSSGEELWRTPQDVADSVVAFPGELRRGAPMVAAFKGGQVEMVPRDSVKYEFPTMEDTFSPLGNLVPLKSMIKGQRAVMASRMITQALPLVNAEAPLVRGAVPGNPARSFEEEYSKHMGAVFADAPARVEAVGPGSITLRDSDGKTREVELYDNMPMNRKTLLTQTPVVQPGDFVQPGQLLARSNYTDDTGTTALGLNARVAYIPFRGMNFEDAVVISESMAKRLTSEHMYQHFQERTPQHKTGKKAFVSIFPSQYSKEMLERFDDDGVIKPGTRVEYGDPLILGVKQREVAKHQLHRGRKPTFANDTITWEHHAPGTVTDIAADAKGATVIVKSTSTMEVGDKLSGRMGDKGIISEIVPDDQMPQAADGKPFEILFNPLGLISRVNPAQLVEAALGKIAAKTGKPYKIPDFEDQDDLTEYALEELRKHNISDTETVIDPETGRKIPDVMTGNRWVMKLHHMAESKGQGRGLGAYTAEGTPAKGGATGSKRLGMLEVSALISHGAGAVAEDASQVRGQSSPEMWAQYMAGFKPPTAQVPRLYAKFVGQLKGSGINVVRDGSKTHIMALTGADVDRLTEGRVLTSGDTVDWRAGLAPKRGGLFDERLTGGHGGGRWTAIALPEPLPNPVMEEPIRRLLGLTKPQLEAVIAGRRELGGHSGPKALQLALSKLDLNKELIRARAEIAGSKKTARDAAVRRLGYIKDSIRLGLHPRDWMWDKVPVLPPAWRPVSTMGTKQLPLVADSNYLYKELWDATQQLSALRDQLGDDVGEERLAVYRALHGVVGLGDPIHPKNQERQVKGILKHVFGSSPKTGVVQRRLLGSSVDLVGRAVISPNADLDMDEVAIPEDKAWEIYKPFIVRGLVRAGTARLAAVRAVDERSQAARATLLAEMARRPVIINRAPTLHRYGLMAARPRLTKNKTLEISPLVVGGFNADFDGDAMNYHVPATDEAAQEALDKMLPSRNLLSAGNFQVTHKPTQEYVGGLYEASARVDTKNAPRVFATPADAIRAYRRGEIGVDRRVEILQDY